MPRAGTADAPYTAAGSHHAVHRIASLVLQLSVRQLRTMNKRTIFTDVKRSVGEAEWCRTNMDDDGPALRLGLRAGDGAEDNTVVVGTNPDMLCTRPGFTLGQIVLSQTKLTAALDRSSSSGGGKGKPDSSSGGGGAGD